MIASVSIQVAVHGQSSFLRKVYTEPPFKVANITEAGDTGQLQLMLMSASPGVLDEDNYSIVIRLEEGSKLQLSTQSYQRLFIMTRGAAQNIIVEMAKDASLLYLPHPVVPHESAIFRTGNKIYLSDGCHLIWGEIMTCGRKLNGERFLFSFYHAVTEIFLNGKMVVKENLLMAPATMEISAIGQLEGYTHQASLVYLSPSCLINEQRGEISAYLSAEKDIIFGITAAPVNGLIIRILGSRAEQLFTCLKILAGIMHRPLNKAQTIYE